jgi:hypothetical protein
MAHVCHHGGAKGALRALDVLLVRTEDVEDGMEVLQVFCNTPGVMNSLCIWFRT